MGSLNRRMKRTREVGPSSPHKLRARLGGAVNGALQAGASRDDTIEALLQFAGVLSLRDPPMSEQDFAMKAVELYRVAVEEMAEPDEDDEDDEEYE